MAYILFFIERLYNSIRYNGFYILLSLLFPFIIWKFDAGKEIIVSMTEYGFSMNIGLTLLAFSALSLSVWCVPTLAIQVFQFFNSCGGRQQQLHDSNKIAVRNCLYQQLVNVYNGRVADPAGCNAGEKAYKAQLPVRYFAMAPWVLFIMTCLQTFLGNSIMIAGLIVIALCIAAINKWKKAIIGGFEFLLTKDKQAYSKRTFLIRYTALAIVFFAVIIAFVLILYHNKNVTGLKWWLCTLNIFFLLGFYSFLLYLENSRLDRYSNKPGSQLKIHFDSLKGLSFLWFIK